jgi:MFS family permease
VNSARASRLLLSATFVETVGAGMFEVAMPLYLISTLGMSATIVSVGFTIGAIAALLLLLPVGQYVDRHGPRRMVPRLYLVQAAAAGAVLIDNVWLACAAIAVGRLAGRVVVIARYPIVLGIAGADVRVLRAKVRSLSNVGFPVGYAVTAGLFAVSGAYGYIVCLLLNVLTYIIATLIQVRTMRELPAKPIGPAFGTGQRGRPLRTMVSDVRFSRVAAVHGLLYLQFPLLSLGIPIFVATRPGISDLVIPAAMTLNTILIAVLQIRVARGIATIRQAVTSWVVSAVITAAACVLFSAAARLTTLAFVIVIAAALALTAAELAGAAGSFVLSDKLAKQGMETQYQSVFQLATTLGQILGPLVIAVLCVAQGIFPWLVAAAAFIVVAAAASVVVPKTDRAVTVDA